MKTMGTLGMLVGLVAMVNPALTGTMRKWACSDCALSLSNYVAALSGAAHRQRCVQVGESCRQPEGFGRGGNSMIEKGYGRARLVAGLSLLLFYWGDSDGIGMAKTAQSARPHHQSDTVRDDFDFDGRQVRVVLPASRADAHTTGDRQLALVLALAGYGVTGEEMLREPGLGPGFGVLPGMDDVIVAAPDGSIHPVLGARFWNATDACCGFESQFGPQVDDVDYLTRLTDTLLSRYPVDARRVYVIGHSNGGMMAHRLACDAPERYASFVAMAGNTYYSIADCGLDQQINLLQIQGTADPVNLLDGGVFPLGDAPYPSTIGTVERVAELVGCHGHLVRKGRLDLESRLFSGDSRRETQVSGYTGCRGATIDLWLIEGGGHLWFLSCDPTVESGCTAFEPTDSRTSVKIWQWVRRFRTN
jgi:polyhydroxybutyrate depolymerase